jgi:CheY-like chemotaxis protein
MHRPATVLLVDDEPSLLYLHRLVLELAGYSVVEAADGAQALERIRERSPDLVVSDLMMPVMDGHALIAALQADDELRTIPVVVVTASATKPIDGAAALLKKPCDPDDLVATAAAALSERST